MHQISVIIPTYNYGIYLTDCINSLKEQILKPFEIIVVDDGSSDDTRRIVSSFKDRNIIYLYQSHKGASAARNNGFGYSSGEYILFLDADDMLLPQALVKMLNCFKKSKNIGVVFSDYFWVDEYGYVIRKESEHRNHYDGNLREKLNHETFIAPSAALIKRRCMGPGKLFDEKLPCFQDWDFFYRISEDWQFGYIEEVLMKYRVHPGVNGIWNDSHENKIGKTLEALEHILKKYKLHRPVPTVLYNALVGLYLEGNACEKAQATAKKGLAVDNSNIFLKKSLIDIEYRLDKNATKAIEGYKTILVKIKTNLRFYADTLLQIGKVHLENGIQKKAEEYFDLILKLKKFCLKRLSDEALFNKAIIAYEQARFNSANDMLDLLLDATSKTELFAFILIYKIKCLLELNQPDEAELFFNMLPHNHRIKKHQIRLIEARISQKKGNDLKALSIFNSLLRKKEPATAYQCAAAIIDILSSRNIDIRIYLEYLKNYNISGHISKNIFSEEELIKLEYRCASIIEKHNPKEAFVMFEKLHNKLQRAKTPLNCDLVAGTYYHRGAILFGQNRLLESEACFMKCTEYLPDHKKAESYLKKIKTKKSTDLLGGYVSSVIKRPIPDNRGKRCYKKTPRYLDRRQIENIPHIIFIAYYPDPHILKKVSILKSARRIYATLLAGCIRQEIKIENYFDQYYEYKNFSELLRLVRQSNPHAWHAVFPDYHPAMVIKGSEQKTRMVVDIPDPAFFLVNEKNDFSVKLEKEILKSADYIIHKLPGEAWNILKRAYGLNCKGTTVISYPQAEFLCRPVLKPTASPPHLVYAGGIIPYKIALERGHENHIFDDLIKLTGPDTFELSIYVNQNARNMPWHQHKHYFDLENTHKYFHFKKGLPYHKITKALSKYDAGIFFDNLLKASYNPDHFKYNIASKFFTYLEAGLPIIIFEEATAMARLVEKFKLGAIYKAREPRTLLQAVNEVKANDYRENINVFRTNCSMQKNAGKLIEAYSL
jgi:glycosyltransferase involved in cell wall biosynthesis